MAWRQMTEHRFPWDVSRVIVLAFAKDEPDVTDVFQCLVGEHGAFFLEGGGLLSLHEQGWIPYAWREDDSPARNDELWPPMWADYLTDSEASDPLN